MTRRRTGFVDPNELDQLVPARLIWRNYALSAEVLDHALVFVVGYADAGEAFENRRERGDRHSRGTGRERDEHFVADEAVRRLRARRRRILDLDETDRRMGLQ